MTPTRRSLFLLVTAGVFAFAGPVAGQLGPAPAATHLPPEVMALACAPTMVFEAHPTPLRVTGGQDSFIRRSFIPGDLITINAGTNNGIDVGQEFYTRRVQVAARRSVSRETPGTVRTSGWIRVYAVDDTMSLATITHACDSIELNDYLEPFALPVLPVVSSERPAPQRENYGRVLTGTDRRSNFSKGDFFLVDRGSNHGVTAGAQFVVYRDKRQDDNFLFELGEAVAVQVAPETSTLQVTLSRDGFRSGDYVAIRK